jgi:hypothetical protein
MRAFRRLGVPTLPVVLILSWAFFGNPGWAQEERVPADGDGRSPAADRSPHAEDSLVQPGSPGPGHVDQDHVGSGVDDPRDEDVHGAHRVPPEWFGRPRPYRYGYFYPHYIPWYAPQTIPYKNELVPPPVAGDPRLGLGHNYPYAWQMGLQLPADTSPLDIPALPPYTGIVQQLKAAESQAESAAFPEERAALALMRAGQYRRAGQLLVAGLERGEDPRYPLLLAEIFVGLGKYGPAEHLVRRGYDLAGNATAALRTVDGALAARFATLSEFEHHVGAIAESTAYPVLRRYLQLRQSGRKAAPPKGTLVAR